MPPSHPPACRPPASAPVCTPVAPAGCADSRSANPIPASTVPLLNSATVACAVNPAGGVIVNDVVPVPSPAPNHASQSCCPVSATPGTATAVPAAAVTYGAGTSRGSMAAGPLYAAQIAAPTLDAPDSVIGNVVSVPSAPLMYARAFPSPAPVCGLPDHPVTLDSVAATAARNMTSSPAAAAPAGKATVSAAEL